MKKDLFVLMLLIIPAVAMLLRPGYFSMHDDLQSMRQYQLDKCFADGQIPCRWVPDMGFGYGYPLFNFYPPLPYYLGHIFRLTGMAYIDVVKAVGLVGFGITALFMYMLGRQFWGRRGGFIASLFYTYAPYHSVDYFVRGAVNEFFAMAFYPAVFFTSYRLIRDGQPRWAAWLGLSVAGVMLSHNPMLMIFTPVFLAWILFWWYKFRSLRSFPLLTVAALLAFGLAAFFTLPVVFEQKFAHVETLVIGYFNFLAHFLDFRQIFFNINWGYGSSIYGPDDTMSFALGHLHWIIPAVVGGAVLFSRRLRQSRSLIIFLGISLVFTLFMTHFKATPIWKAIKPLEFLQFPWRLMTLGVFLASFVSGAVALIAPRRLYVVLVMVAVIALNANYFRPDKWYPDMTDAKKFSGRDWYLLVTSGIFDYLPIYAKMPPPDPAGNDLDFVEGSGVFTRIVKNSHLQQYQLEVAETPATVELQTYYFPGWRAWVDGQEQPIDPSRDPLLGRIQVDVPAGTHTLVVKFTNTPVRSVGNTISGLTWAGLLAAGVLQVLKKQPLV